MGKLTEYAELQWSHVFSDMVSRARRRLEERHQRASMEPCLFRHGKAAGDVRPSRVRAASMEPCLFRHGKEDAPTWQPKTPYEASMEPCLFRHGKVPLFIRILEKYSLQWSHVFSDMVSLQEVHGGVVMASRFNGAMSFQTW